jgi:hypothetical protein
MPANVIFCPGCGTKYAWKPQLRGKRVKCKCGESFLALDPATAETEDGFDIVGDAPAAAATPQPPPVASRGARGTVVDPAQFAAVYPTHRARIQQDAPDEDESSGSKKMLVPILVLVLVVGGAVGGGIMLSRRGAADRPTGTQLGEDPNVVAMINEQTATEITEWLKNPRNMVMGQATNQALNRAQQWYGMGAKKVFAFGGGMTMSLGIELPDDPAQRKQLFDWQANWHSEMFEKVQTDVGQKYLLIKMRI